MALVRKVDYSKAGSVEAVSNAAETLARLKSHGLLKLPVDVYSVAEFLGVDVQEEVMDEELSGFIEPRRSGWLIGVNSYHHPNRQRFTVAHEIGHYLLHRPSKKHVDTTFARRAGKRDKMENDADGFAAALLMPEAQLREHINRGETSLERLAAYFGVSLMALKYRVQSLGYSVR